MTATHRLSAILAADVAGYSRLMGADEGRHPPGTEGDPGRANATGQSQTSERAGVGAQLVGDENFRHVAEAIKLEPGVRSLAEWRASIPWTTNPDYWALRESTLHIGLRRAGFADK
jgi:hypothetical protein